MSQRVAVHTMGCRANQADGIFLSGNLLEKGYELVEWRDGADVYIINSCTVTAEADREARSLSRQAKKQNPAAKVVMTGCYAQTQPEKIAQLSSIDHVIGNPEKEKIPELLPVLSQNPMNTVSPIFKHKDVPSFGKTRYTDHVRAHVKIQDGCDKFCSYCIIPYARGRNRSVRPGEILDELFRLADAGFHEAVLTGIHIGTYGEELGLSLEQLLMMIEKERPLPRIRLSSLDPEEITNRLIDIVGESEIICPHLHIAVQSGDDQILAEMKRRYRAGHFKDILKRVHQYLPDIAIGTDVMVGFPGEDETAFMNSYGLVEDLPVTYVHVFPYSKRIKTAAAQLSGQVSETVKKHRVKRLRALSDKKRKAFFEKFIGQQSQIIIESKENSAGLRKGITPYFMPVLVDASEQLIGKNMSVLIDKVDAEGRVYGSLQ